MTNHPVYPGKNDFKTWCILHKRLDLLKEWDTEKNTISPTQILPKSTKYIYWKHWDNKHNCWHEWKTRLNGRTNREAGCPYCAGQRRLQGVNDFKTWCNDVGKQYLLEEWDYEKNTIRPEDVTKSSTAQIHWKHWSEKHNMWHEWKTSLRSRANAKRGCPICSNRKIIKGVNDVVTWCHTNNYTVPIEEWDSEKNTQSLDELSYGSPRSFFWKHTDPFTGEVHEWKAAMESRTSGRVGCPICSRRRITTPLGDWCRTNHKQFLLDEWDEEKNGNPNAYAYSSNKTVTWNCPNGHNWESTVQYRTGAGATCPYCRRTKTNRPVRNNTTGVTYANVLEASKEYYIDYHSILRCCDGRQKTSGYCHWSYVDETK